MSLQPEQLDILQSLMKTTPQTAHELRIPLERVEIFLKNVERFVLDNYKRIGVQPYSLLFSHSKRGSSTIDLQTVKHCINIEKPILYVDDNLNFLKSKEGSIDTPNFQKITKEEKLLGISINGTHLLTCLCGNYLDSENLLSPDSGPPIISGYYKKAYNIDEILKDHYESRVRNERGFRYWKNKTDRTLLAGSHGTEDIFHGDLFWWLNTYVTDKLKVVAEAHGFGQEKVDIFIVTTKGTYVIEVKWLGRNEHKTTYSKRAINSALKQVRYYLNNDDEFVSASVVAYDGRSHEKHLSDSDFDNSLRHELCNAPKIIFLESESTSKKAKR